MEPVLHRAKLFKTLIREISARLPKGLARPLRRWSHRLFDWRTQKVVLQQKVELQQLLATFPPDRPLILFAPSLTWNTQLFQRPQQLALALAQQGASVLYLVMEPDLKKPLFEEIRPNLFLTNLLVRAVADLPAPWVYVLTWNTAYLSQFDHPRVIYDYVDDIGVFHGDTAEYIENHRALLRQAEIILVTARKLHQEVLPLRPDALLCPNAVDLAHFISPAAEPGPPADLAALEIAGRPVIGYYGALARWFDYPLVHRLAEEHPEYVFVLIGPNYDGTLDQRRFLNLPNLHWLGVKPYQDLPAYLRAFDVAMIPFLVNEITHATSPLKLFEYMAGGKPVVITPMQESQYYPGVLVAGDAATFATRIAEALTLRHDPAYLQTIAGVARQNTWQARAADLLSAMR